MEKYTTPRSSNVFNSLTDAELGKKFPAFNGSRGFMILLKQATGPKRRQTISPTSKKPTGMP
jgi:hypothetical protein